MRSFVTGLFDIKQMILSSIGLAEYDPLESYKLADDYLESRSSQSWDQLNLDKWREAMDFSQIEALHLEQEKPVFYEVMKDELPSLKHLSFDWRNSGPSVPQERIEFIRSVPPLESLSITIGVPYYYDDGPKNRTRFPLDDILDVHGRSLESLSLKQLECREPELRRPMLSVDDIDSIRESCSNLSHLCVDIDRNAAYGWPNHTFNAITNISSLASLTLRLEIGADLHTGREHGEYYWNEEGLGGQGPFREPRMTLEIAEQLFGDLRAKKQGEQLSKVDFVVGDYENKPYSGPLYFPEWDEGRARMFTCEAAASNDEKEGYRCTMLGGRDPWDDELVALEGIDLYD